MLAVLLLCVLFVETLGNKEAIHKDIVTTKDIKKHAASVIMTETLGDEPEKPSAKHKVSTEVVGVVPLGTSHHDHGGETMSSIPKSKRPKKLHGKKKGPKADSAKGKLIKSEKKIKKGKDHRQKAIHKNDNKKQLRNMEPSGLSKIVHRVVAHEKGKKGEKKPKHNIRTKIITLINGKRADNHHSKGEYTHTEEKAGKVVRKHPNLLRNLEPAKPDHKIKTSVSLKINKKAGNPKRQETPKRQENPKRRETPKTQKSRNKEISSTSINQRQKRVKSSRKMRHLYHFHTE